jgi:hypothetical protein
MSLVLDAVPTLQLQDEIYSLAHETVAADALGQLLAAGLPAGEPIAALARGPLQEVRRGIAAGLDPHRPDHRELLDVLAADPVASVREAAREGLAAVGGVDWWRGKWASDPVPRLGDAASDETVAALRTVAGVLDEPHYKVFGNQQEALLAALDALPAALAVEAVEGFARALDYQALHRAGPLLRAMLARDGGEDAFVRLLGPWAAHEPATKMYALANVVKGMPDARRGRRREPPGRAQPVERGRPAVGQG